MLIIYSFAEAKSVAISDYKSMLDFCVALRTKDKTVKFTLLSLDIFVGVYNCALVMLAALYGIIKLALGQS